MNSRKRILALLLLVLPVLGTRAGNVMPDRDTIRVSLYFKVNTVTPTVESRQNIERAISVIPAGIAPEHVFIEGWASPEGTEEANDKISQRRALAAELFIREYFPLSDGSVTLRGGTDWKGMLQFCAKRFPAEDMQVIRKSMSLGINQRKAVIAKLDGGKTWKSMNEEIFPLLRRADIAIVYRNQKKNDAPASSAEQRVYVTETAPARKDTVIVFHKDTVYYLPADRRRDPLRVQALYPRYDNRLRRPVMAFRSNLLLPLLNVGVECPISNRWSVAADFYYPWCPREWMNKWTAPQMNCLQGIGGYLEGRYWFGPEHRNGERTYGKYRLLGHSLGLIAGAGYYDVEWNGKGQQGEAYTAGLGYTYAFPVGRRGGVHLEVEVAVGAVLHQWHPYDVNDEGGYLLRRKDEDRIPVYTESKWSFYPIKAGFNLVVPIFTDKPLKTRKTVKR